MCLGITPCGDDGASVVKTGQRAVDLLIADLAERRRDQAIARISDVTTVAGRTQIVRTPTQFVDRLLGCIPIKNSTSSLGRDNYRVEWLCSGKKYFADFDAAHEKPYITVILEDEVTAKEPVYAPAPPASGPDRHLPPTRDLIDLIAGSVLAGDYDVVRAMMSARTIVSVARLDKSRNVLVYESEELGPSAILPMVAESFEHVGKPVSFECSQERYGATCEFRLPRPGVALTCWIGAYNGRLNAIRFVWKTPEQDILDAAKNWEDG